MSFDFSGFSHNPPAGCKILEAGSELRLKTSTGVIFIVREIGGQFELWVMTEINSAEQFVLMRSELHRVLRLLGYRQTPGNVHNVKERMF